MELIKANFQALPISSLKMDLLSLRKLFEMVKGINSKTIKLEEENIRTNSKDPRFQLPKEEVDKYVERVLDNYLVSIEITEFNGNYTIWYDPELIFKDEKFPDRIKTIRISNAHKFLNRQDLYQFFKVTINIDFSKNFLVDFLSNPSHETYNQSYVEIGGLDIDWVNSSLSTIKDFIQIRRNNKSWIHKRNVYDLFLWLIIVPLAFWNLQKVEIWLDHLKYQFTGSFKVFVLIYSFLIGLFIISFVFKYARWLYPPIELLSQVKNSVRLQRLLLFLIISGIAVKFFVDLFFDVIPFLFS